MLVVCRECKKLKRRIGHDEGHHWRRVYRDELRKRWNGQQCPDCKNAPKTGTRYVEEKIGESKAVYTVQPKRLCRSCGEVLIARYFQCAVCLPISSYYDIFEEYQTYG